MLRIATRKSKLALWQAEHVAARLREHHPGLVVELVGMTTQGDRIRDRPLAALGGKGLFIKELEIGMEEGRADLAVHSMKDVPAEIPPGMTLPVILPREDPRDAFVANHYAHPDNLPPGSRVGTCSLRRKTQLAARYPQLQFIDLRGNVDTRLQRLDDGDFEAIVLAAAGLKRLGLGERIRCALDPALCLPAVGQGAIGIECRADDARTQELIAVLDDPDSHNRVLAERGLNARLQGSCQIPLAGFAEHRDDRLHLQGLVGDPQSYELIADQLSGPRDQAFDLGQELGERLLALGAGPILERLSAEHL